MRILRGAETKSGMRPTATLHAVYVAFLCAMTVANIAFFHSFYVNSANVKSNCQDINPNSTSIKPNHQEVINQQYPKTHQKSQAQRCSGPKRNASFNSQSGEDRYLIAQFFKNICGGSYIEMGALDGNRYSNSYYFNAALDWKGLLIEANPRNYKKLVVNRKNELVTPIHAAVCDVERDIHYVSLDKDAVGGIVEFAPKSFQERWWTKEMIDNAPAVKCLPLNKIVQNTTIPASTGEAFFDFFSLDVEGAEYNVLRTIDFNKLSFGVVFYESDMHNPLKNMATRNFLEEKGYRVIGLLSIMNGQIGMSITILMIFILSLFKIRNNRVGEKALE